MGNPHPDLSKFEITAPWALATGKFGVAVLVVAFLSFVAALALLCIKRTRNTKAPSWAFALGCFGFFLAFAALAALFLKDQFAFEYVRSHSEHDNEPWYKFAAIWAGQQGSFLLWACTSSLFTLIALRKTGPYRNVYLATCAAFLGTIAAILIFDAPQPEFVSIFRLNLFEGQPYIPPNGAGIAPSLYNYWVVIHPPTIFLGFGSLTVLFAYAVSAIASSNFDDWLPRIRPWASVSTAITGLGLAMGGFWAYDMLGWGGFWKWDPVENASFVPWMLCAALIHGLIVQSTRKKWHLANALLAGLPFVGFAYGTFLTRSGLMGDVSVHSFVSMDASALKILKFFVIVTTAGFLGFWGWRALKFNRPEAEDARKGLTRDQFYATGILLMILMAMGTAIGMSVPFIQALRGMAGAAVEEHQYHITLSWIYVPIMLLMAVTPFVAWRGLPLRTILGKALNSFSAALFITGCLLIWINQDSSNLHVDAAKRISFPWNLSVPVIPWMGVLTLLSAFVLTANLTQILGLIRRSRVGLGGFISHAGLAIMMAGLILSRGFEREQSYVIQPGISAVPLRPGGSNHLIELINEDKIDLEKRGNTMDLRMYGPGMSDIIARPQLYYRANEEGKLSPQPRPDIIHMPGYDLYLEPSELTVDGLESLSLAPGQSGKLKGFLYSIMQDVEYTITYKKFVQEGEAGKAGTKFGASLVVEVSGLKANVTPMFAVGQGPIPTRLDANFNLVLNKMDAGTKSVQLGLQYVRPLMPLTVITKPLTSLVWLGTGILTFGGLLSAFYRRFRKEPPANEPEPKEESGNKEEETQHAALPVA